MRNKKRMLAAGLIAVALLSAVSGCGSTTGNMQDTKGIQGTTGVAGGTVQGSGSAENASDTAAQNNGNTADHNAQDNSSGTGTAQNGSNTTDHTAQTGNNDSSGTSQAGVSQHATAGSATMVNGGITEQEAKNIAAGNAGVTEEQIQYITVKQDWDDGRARYEVEFTAAGVEYDYELDASDGRILSADSEVIDKGYRASQNGTTGSRNAAGSSQTALLLKERILKYAHELTRMPEYNLDIIDGQIVRITDNRVLMSLGDLSTEALYSLSHSEHLSAESTAQIKSNAYSFGCTFAEVEVDIPMCKVKLLDIVNVHDAGTLINPALAEAQVHGGMSMGIGFGLSENLLFDPKTGRALNNNLLDYKLSTFMDHPRLRAYFVENAEPTSAFGTKSLGEPPTCSIAPAIRNAVYQATGVYVNDAPVNPHHLFRSMKEQHMFEEGGEANV